MRKRIATVAVLVATALAVVWVGPASAGKPSIVDLPPLELVAVPQTTAATTS